MDFIKRLLPPFKTNTAIVKNDVPAKIMKEFACELAAPYTEIVNSLVCQGIFPNICKLEMVTPVPKVFPPKNVDDLRKIAGLKNFAKVTENMVSERVISDMSEGRHISQCGNEKGISVNHYLIKTSWG